MENCKMKSKKSKKDENWYYQKIVTGDAKEGCFLTNRKYLALFSNFL